MIVEEIWEPHSILEIIFSGFAWRTTNIKIGTNASADVSSEPLLACLSNPTHQPCPDMGTYQR
jgi:hypothetical protein